MVAPTDMSPYNQAKDELGVTVKNGDEVVWVASAFDSGAEVNLLQAESPGVLDTNMRTEYNNDGTVTALATSTCNSGIYRFAFTLDDQDFQPYTWDPYITIE